MRSTSRLRPAIRRATRVLLAGAAALAFAGPVVAHAQGPKATTAKVDHPVDPKAMPKKLVDARYKDIKAAVAKAADKAALTAEVTTILGKLVDWDAFSRRTLTATVWDELSAAQRATFRDAYAGLIVKKYANRFKPKATFRVELRGDTEVRKDGVTAVVKTTVFTDDDGREVGVDVNYFFVLVQGGRWRVADIITDGVSRARTYRPKFKRIYAKRGFKALIKAIEKNTKRR